MTASFASSEAKMGSATAMWTAANANPRRHCMGARVTLADLLWEGDFGAGAFASEKQIPGGNDRKKSKGNRGSFDYAALRSG